MRTLLLAILFVGLSPLAYGDFSPHKSYPLQQLPKHIPHKDKGICIFSDYQNKKGKFLAVYIINNTEEDQRLRPQDRDLFLKLETKNLSGIWERSQKHQDSWCGNSYYPITIEKKHFQVVLVSMPGEGAMREVRFRL